MTLLFVPDRVSARIPVTAAVGTALMLALAGCTADDTGSRTAHATPTATATASMSCADVKAALDRLDNELYLKPQDHVLLKQGDDLVLGHPACFDPGLVEGAWNFKKDLDKGITPTLPVNP